MKCKKNNIIKKLSAVLTASALLLTGCSGAKSSTQTDQDLTYTDMLFDTVIKIQILDPADESILDGLKKLCEKYDTMFSTTNTDSELYKLNHANGQPFTVSSETANLIQEGIHYSELSAVPLISPLNRYRLSGISRQINQRFHLPMPLPRP